MMSDPNVECDHETDAQRRVRFSGEIGSMARRRKSSHTTNAIRAKRFREAKALGPINTVKPESVRFDGSPVAGPGRVYVMRAGTVYHPAWCHAVGVAWDAGPDRVLVIAEDAVGNRRACQTCRDPLQL